jgi:hypothetical protein
VGLAGQHVALVQLSLFQRVVLVHRDGAGKHLGAAGSADSAGAGERHVGADPQGRIEDRFAGLGGAGNFALTSYSISGGQ